MVNIGETIRSLFGEETEVSRMRPVSGGDINEAYAVLLTDGRRLFLKENTRNNAGFFRAERDGLEAIRKTDTLRVPQVLSNGISDDSAYLIMEYLEPAPAKEGFWEHFGRELAAMHRTDTSQWVSAGSFGFPEDNFIGAGEQVNAVRSSWIRFFRECRLEVQFRRGQHYFDKHGRRQMQSLLDHLDKYLTEPEYPSLLHGDLWGGNFMTGPDGYAWLIDPAVYVGHAEADLAMTELFGGFAPAFYDAYREAGSIAPGYTDRRDLYNLYHLLNHLNLFGSGYYGSVMRIVRRYG